MDFKKNVHEEGATDPDLGQGLFQSWTLIVNETKNQLDMAGLAASHIASQPTPYHHQEPRSRRSMW
jgi:hypothetical protein